MLALANKWCNIAENKQQYPVLPPFGSQIVAGLTLFEDKGGCPIFSASLASTAAVNSCTDVSVAFMILKCSGDNFCV